MAHTRPFWQAMLRRRSPRHRRAPEDATQTGGLETTPIEIGANDSLIEYFQDAPQAVDLDRLDIDSPAVRAMRAAGIQLVVPLVSQGELIGLLNLGPRRSQQEYSADDRQLLTSLSAQATPVVRVAQLVRQRQEEGQERERIEHELQVARLIQQTLLPKSVPELTGYLIDAHYQPAREVGGDFYDFIDLHDGRLGIVVGDVSDKGVPAALVMATTRSVMRAAATQFNTPGQVLHQANELLCPDIPPNMFVTCLYAILDPGTGRLQYANAGHDLPYLHRAGDVSELWATGMPLGLMLGMHYEEKEIVLRRDDTVLFYSDGLVEAHDRQRRMFGFPRLQNDVQVYTAPEGASLVEYLLGKLADFTGPEWDQEDDIMLLTLQCSGHESRQLSPSEVPPAARDALPNKRDMLAEFSVPSEPGNERLAMKKVAETVQGMGLSPSTIERLNTAVGEVTMNAMEHGNRFRADVPVLVQVLRVGDELVIRITDQGMGPETLTPEAPDLEAKLAGAQTPRGWGLFLIKEMVDEVRVTNGAVGHTVELVLHYR